MERKIEEIEAERGRYMEYMKQYTTVNGVYNGPELFLRLYRNADRELEEAMRQARENNRKYL